MRDFSIAPDHSAPVEDVDLEDLLKAVYVAGGFTEAAAGEAQFRASAVRARGDLLVARDAQGQLIGTVIAVFPGSPACRFARDRESEMQLLCVRQDRQRRGVGAALVAAAVDTARRAGASRMILWTQPSMTAAQRLYVNAGFERVPTLDFSRAGRTFLVFARSL